MSEENTILTSAHGYNVNNMIFSDPQQGNIPGSKPAIVFKRVLISTKNPNGTVGSLIFETERCFSYGVSENKSLDTGKLNGYVLPICLYTKNGVTDREKEWVSTINSVVERCKKYLIDNKDELEQWTLEMADLKKLNPLYWKQEKGKIVEDAGPTLYGKLIVSKKNDNKIMTIFHDGGENGEPQDINPLDLVGKYCYVRAAIKVESIFIGNKISLQLKVYEVSVKIIQSGMPRLLSARPESKSKVIMKDVEEADGEDSKDDKGDEDDKGSIKDEDEDEEEKKVIAPAPVEEKPEVKRVVRRVVRKP